MSGTTIPIVARSLLGQASRQQIGPVVKFMNSRLDTFAKFLANMTLFVDDRGNGKNRNPSRLGYIINTGVFVGIRSPRMCHSSSTRKSFQVARSFDYFSTGTDLLCGEIV
jgi:hypothetical protein